MNFPKNTITPVFLRLSTRVSHSQSLVEEEEKQEVALKDYEKNPQKYVMMPGNAIKRHVVVEDRINALKEMAETSPLNRVEENGSKIGIIRRRYRIYVCKRSTWR